MKRFKLIKKGLWYYEMQILMFVFMWKHDLSYKPFAPRGLVIGRLHIWYDRAWTMNHSIAYFLEQSFKRWCNSMKNKILRDPLVKEWRSILAYIRLHQDGFRITYSDSSVKGFNIYRFWFDETDLFNRDIDYVDGRYYLVWGGKSHYVGGLPEPEKLKPEPMKSAIQEQNKYKFDLDRLNKWPSKEGDKDDKI